MEIVKSERENAIQTVERLARQLGAAEAVLEGGYAQLAEALLCVRDNRYWEGDFESWGAYMAHVSDTYHIGNKQLYHYMSAVKELGGVVDSQDLTEMGISKASVLAEAHRTHGKIPEKTKDGFDFMEIAKDSGTTAKGLRKEIAEVFHKPEDPSGEWYDLEAAFYVTPEEKQEIQHAFRLARQTDPPISTNLKTFMQTKEVILRLCREYIATYEDGQ